MPARIMYTKTMPETIDKAINFYLTNRVTQKEVSEKFGIPNHVIRDELSRRRNKKQKEELEYYRQLNRETAPVKTNEEKPENGVIISETNNETKRKKVDVSEMIQSTQEAIKNMSN